MILKANSERDDSEFLLSWPLLLWGDQFVVDRCHSQLSLDVTVLMPVNREQIKMCARYEYDYLAAGSRRAADRNAHTIYSIFSKKKNSVVRYLPVPTSYGSYVL